MVRAAGAQCVLAGAGLEMESFALKQQFVREGHAVTVGDLSFGVGRARRGCVMPPGRKGAAALLRAG